MGQFVNNKKVTLPPEGTAFDYSKAIQEIAALVGVGWRSDGKIYLADLCIAKNRNKWAKNKPFYSTAKAFASSEDRDIARIAAYYGTMPTIETHAENPTVTINSGYALDTRVNEGIKRLRDWDGYDHTATDAVNIKNADSYTYNSDIMLDINPSTGYNMSIIELMKALNAEDSFDRFAWVVIDQFGFSHALQSFATLAEVESYLAGTSKLTLNLAEEYRNKTADWWKNGVLNDYVPPRAGSRWTIGIAGIWDDSTPTTSFPYSGERIRMFNALKITDNTVNNDNVTPLSLGGFTPNTVIGSVYSGKHRVYESMNGDTVIECCSDDILFMGVKVANNSNGAYVLGFSTTSSSSYTYFQLEAVVTDRNANNYYSGSIAINSANALVQAGGMLGSEDGEGTAWSEEMFCIRLTNLWNKVSMDGDVALLFLTVNHSPANTLVSPYITIKLKNIGRTLSQLTAEEKKAEYKDSIGATSWNKKS